MDMNSDVLDVHEQRNWSDGRRGSIAEVSTDTSPDACTEHSRNFGTRDTETDGRWT
jgi:hypothetical protein